MRRRNRGLKWRIRRLKRRLSNSWVGQLGLLTPTTFWLGLVGIVLLGSVLGLVLGGWDWLRPLPSEGQSGVTTESRSTTIRNVGFVIAGAVALVFAVWRGVVAERQTVASQSQAATAQRQAETAQQALLNERYQNAQEALDSGVPATRLNGIRDLRQLDEEHPEQYHVQVMRLFCEFVKNHTEESESTVPGEEDGEPIRELREDVQTVMYAIGRRSVRDIFLEGYADNFRLDLRNVNLYHGRLSNLNLSGADLSDTNLSNADLSDARLYDTDLSGAHLYDADLSGARLAGAYLTGADLENAILTGASFSRRWIKGDARNPATGLTQAQLDEARSDPNNPPNLEGVLDADGKQLVWGASPLTTIQ